MILNNFDDDATATQRQLDMQVHKWNWAVDVAFTHAVLLMMEAGAFVNEAPATNLVVVIALWVQLLLDVL